jgi:hypothetical protein
VGAAEPQPDGDLVLGSEDVLDVRLQVGERVLHHLEALPPHLSPVLRFGQFGQVDDDVRDHVGHALVSVADVESLPPNVFDGFDAGLLHVLARLRSALATQAPRTSPD